MRSRFLLTLAATAGLLLAVGAPLASAGGTHHAAASFVDASGTTIGWARLVEDARGVVHVNAHVAGLTPGLHGLHIHAVGACSPTFAAAGPHFNPEAHQHGLDNPDGPHAGDLPNLIVNDEGVGHLNATTDRVTLGGGVDSLFDADGSALIIHANEDDQVTNATNGNSGARVACAVLEPD